MDFVNKLTEQLRDLFLSMTAGARLHGGAADRGGGGERGVLVQAVDRRAE